jgi:hypothetical protein
VEIVTGAPAPTLPSDEARRLVLEMAAVVRTIFGVPVTVDRPAAAQLLGVELPPPVPSVAMPPIRAIPVASLPVPSLPIPSPGIADPAEPHSMALLQEIAFLDD